MDRCFKTAGRIVSTLTTALGIAYVAGAVLYWPAANHVPFVLYLVTGVTAAIFMHLRGSDRTGVSVNLFLVPLAIIELGLPETILLSIIGVAVSAIFSRAARGLHTIVLLANEATAAAAASFAYHSLMVRGGETAAIGLFFGSSVYFVFRTLPKALQTATSGGLRIGRTWKNDHFAAYPYYLVGASTAGFLSIRNAFVRWEICVLILPVLYVLYRAHTARIADIALLSRRTQEMEEAKRAAEAASRLKSEFVANISHELRTPMAGIIGMTQVALESDQPAEVRDCLETVRGCSDSLLHLLNDLLDFSKIEAGKLELRQVEFRVRSLLASTCQPFTLSALNTNVTLRWQAGEDVPDTVVGDPARLGQVLTNLLGNAMKFTPNGRIQLSVRRAGTASTDRTTLHFAVEDTGIGIPKDKQEAIFESFTQVDGSMTRNYGGTGPGLAICSRLVAQMGGRIWVESEPGSGSTFHFTGEFGPATGAAAVARETCAAIGDAPGPSRAA